jgi:uncharacterized protein YeaO (DUF488 family)
MAISIVRLGTARARGEGVRLGTVRRPPRGVSKGRFASDDWFDVWLPNLSPSADLMQETDIVRTPANWKVFARKFRAELKRPDAAHLLDTLAALSHTSHFSIGCYCEDETTCHRSILRRELTARGAAIA